MGNKKKGTYAGDLSGPGKFAGWVDWRAGQSSSPSKRKDRTSASLEPVNTDKTELRTKVDTGEKLSKLTRQIIPKAKKRLKLRTLNEIFGNIDCQKYYINALKESLETMDLSKLHQFILDHQTYGKSNHTTWNADFAKMVNISPQEEYQGRDEAHTHSRIVAAAQYFLVTAHKADVFQITLAKKQINPWIFIDGKMGPYTVSVLGEYGNSQHKAKRGKGKKLGAHGDAKLDRKDYEKDSPSSKSYEAAREYKNNQLHPANSSDSKVRRLYARLDRAKDTIALSKLEMAYRWLVVDSQVDWAPMNLSTALSRFYNENPKPKNTKDSPKTFRVLNLLAQKVGAQVDDMRIEKGDHLSITPQGVFNIIKADGKSKYGEIKLS